MHLGLMDLQILSNILKLLRLEREALASEGIIVVGRSLIGVSVLLILAKWPGILFSYYTVRFNSNKFF